MDRTSVVSGNIISVGYEDGDQTLEVEYTGGDVYQYQGVPRSTSDEMMGAPSPGEYFHASVLNAFPFHKVNRD